MRNLLSLAVIALIGYMIYTYNFDVRGRVMPILNSLIEEASIGANNAINLDQTLNFIDKIESNPNFIKTGKCKEPINYGIDKFDTKFGITKEYFEDSLLEAEKMWEDAVNINLFNYQVTNPDLKINLVYDYRQETMNELKKLGIEVKESRQSYEEVKNKYDSAKSAYLRYKINYDSVILTFNTRVKTFESQINYYNSIGGAPEEEYKKLMAERVYLAKQLEDIKNMQIELNKLINQVNGLANTLNKLAEILNLNVQKYNSVGAELGDSYEEGLYTENAEGRFIDIYEFQSKDQLVKIIAHEMGHALGIGHLEDEKSIMHAISRTSQELVLTNSDIIAISTICGLEIEN